MNWEKTETAPLQSPARQITTGRNNLRREHRRFTSAWSDIEVTRRGSARPLSSRPTARQGPAGPGQAGKQGEPPPQLSGRFPLPGAQRPAVDDAPTALAPSGGCDDDVAATAGSAAARDGLRYVP